MTEPTVVVMFCAPCGARMYPRGEFGGWARTCDCRAEPGRPLAYFSNVAPTPRDAHLYATLVGHHLPRTEWEEDDGVPVLFRYGPDERLA